MKKLIVASSLLLACCAGGNNPNGTNQQAPPTLTESASETKPTKETRTAKEIRTLSSGSELYFSDGEGEVTILFKEIKAKRLPDGNYNLVMTVQIKNNVGYDFSISSTGWQITDSNMIEIEESGVYDYEFGMFGYAWFSTTVIKNGYGKVEEVGYKVSRGTYYLSLGGEVQGKIEV